MPENIKVCPQCEEAIGFIRVQDVVEETGEPHASGQGWMCANCHSVFQFLEENRPGWPTETLKGTRFKP